MNNRFLNVFFHFLPIGMAIVLLSGFTFAAVQQNYRQSLNDPQLQITLDGAKILRNGGVPAEVVPHGAIFELEDSLQPFVAVYDGAGKPMESSASLYGTPPQPPKGVFDYSKANGYDTVTWQPNPNTRIALVVRYVEAKDEYVASGRNMKEVEARVNNLTKTFVFATIFILFASFICDFIGDSYRRKVMSKINSNLYGKQ